MAQTMTDESVTPKAFRGWSMSLAQLFGSGPKFTITCGECDWTFKRRIPMIDEPGIDCPRCGTVNVLPVTVGTVEDAP